MFPGCTREQLKVSIEGRRVTLTSAVAGDSAVKPEAQESAAAGAKPADRVLYRERSAAAYARTVVLPAEVDQAAIASEVRERRADAHAGEEGAGRRDAAEHRLIGLPRGAAQAARAAPGPAVERPARQHVEGVVATTARRCRAATASPRRARSSRRCRCTAPAPGSAPGPGAFRIRCQARAQQRVRADAAGDDEPRRAGARERRHRLADQHVDDRLLRRGGKVGARLLAGRSLRA